MCAQVAAAHDAAVEATLSVFARHCSVTRRGTDGVDQVDTKGLPTVRGLRYPVENLLELLASGMTIEDVIADHPDLERDDLLAALEFGALATGMRRVVPLGAA